MKLRSFTVPACLAALAAILGCGGGQPASAPAAPAAAAVEKPRELPAPTGDHSAQGNLAVGPDGTVYLSWMETAKSGNPVLKFATMKDEKWSPAQNIIENETLMVNWADFPSLLPMGNGVLAAHWLTNIPDEDEAYTIKMAFSKDDGKTWGKPVAPHHDKAKTEHGFVSMVANSASEVGVAWLDSRKLAGPKKTDDVSLMYTTVGTDGKLGAETTLDGRVCECCQPVAKKTASGTLVVYRGRTKDEIRDITTVRLDGGKWSEPKVVFADGWKINGCPINGPSMAVDGNKVAVAWFTGANEKPKVEAAFSSDGGATWGAPAQVDEGKPMGRVSVVSDPAGALVTWLERGDQGIQVKGRRIDANGTTHPSFVVGTTEPGEAAGFPRAVRAGNSVVIAWTDAKASKVRVAVLAGKS